MSIQQVCVVYVLRRGRGGPEVLLGRKLTGLGAGKVVAPGGKLEPGETAVEAARRELREEVGATFACTAMLKVGINRYRFPTKPAWHQDSHVFSATWTAGDVGTSAELEPFWVSVASVPYADMWADAQYWLPSVLTGGSCDGDYVFASDLTSLAL